MVLLEKTHKNITQTCHKLLAIHTEYEKLEGLDQEANT